MPATVRPWGKPPKDKRPFDLVAAFVAAVLILICAIVVVLIDPPTSASAETAPPIVPNPALTPGVVDPAARLAVICVRGYTSRPGVRHVTPAAKRKVFAEYGVDRRSQHFEVDHLISLELGGSNDIKNLWPESYDTRPLNAHVKDALENRLHALVCAGSLPLGAAQHWISTDWRAAYAQFVGPLPTLKASP